MSSPSYSEDAKNKKLENFKIGPSVTPVNGNGDAWSFYKHVILNAFEMSLLDEIATGKVTEDATWDQDQEDKYKKRQTKITILIQGSFVDEAGTTRNPVMTAQKVDCLQGEIHRARIRDYRAPVNDLQMVDMMLRSFANPDVLERASTENAV
ncbi:Hypothetical protein PHPALM_7171 [Phytophthora palmivora]|uniref:Uncharacterized protein n=1 Tax=Phytophthora palmivora TaxID=4796 RepID=A0A2P4YD03_9STRA|nr:Hypothetical protein PHPALM_7171 [Phytophthora palmivora]